jgi:hypothetical protein
MSHQRRVRMAFKVFMVAAVSAGLSYAAYQHLTTTKPPPFEIAEALAAYKNFPTWMYSNPHNILNIEKPAIGEVVPKLVIKKAWLRFNQRYHPDRWVSNGFSHEATAAAAFEIGRLAEISLTKYHINPYCDISTRLYRNFEAGDEVVGLPYFARDCVCSASHAA